MNRIFISIGVFALLICTSETARAMCNNLVAVGDSITAGNDKYPTLIASSLRSHAFNQAYGGSRWSDLAPRAGVEVDPKLKQTSDCKNPYLILFAGTNDMVTRTAAQTFTDFRTYMSARIAAGWNPAKMIVVTMLPRFQIKDSDRNEYNNALISGAATYGYVLARVDRDASLGCEGCETNKRFYEDGVHPTVIGQQVLANIICHAMNLQAPAACPSYPR